MSHTLSCYKNQLTAYDGQPITYDVIGNPISYRGWSFTWQGGRQLASASNGTTSLSFVYNESGLRTEKTVGNTSHRYVYRGSTLVAEITGDYALYFHHDANGEIVGFTYVSGNTEAEYFYRKNLQGDIIGIVDSTGASVAEYRYDAWGQILSVTGTMASVNPIRYGAITSTKKPDSITSRAGTMIRWWGGLLMGTHLRALGRASSAPICSRIARMIR